MQVTLRVLSAIAAKRDPDESDTQELAEFYGPKPDGIDWDEFACDILQRIIHERHGGRTQASGGGS